METVLIIVLQQKNVNCKSQNIRHTHDCEENGESSIYISKIDNKRKMGEKNTHKRMKIQCQS